MGLPKEDECLKKTRDPKLPSERDVEAHWLMGQLPFRDWCPACVGSKGKEIDHARGEKKAVASPAYLWDLYSPGDELGVSNGRFRWGRNVNRRPTWPRRFRQNVGWDIWV